MFGPASFSQFIGSRPIRALVNQGFHLYAQRRVRHLAQFDPVEVQRQTLRRLIRRATNTRFGRNHGFGLIATVDQYQSRVPLRTYEALWRDYLQADAPRLDSTTWPGLIPYLALTSGTTQGATKYIPVSTAMIASNQQAAQTMVAYHLAARPNSRLFHGKIFFLGGSTNLESPSPGVRQGDLSGIATEAAAVGFARSPSLLWTSHSKLTGIVNFHSSPSSRKTNPSP